MGLFKIRRWMALVVFSTELAGHVTSRHVGYL